MADEPCGVRNFEEVEEKVVSLTKDTLNRAYSIYWSGLDLLKDTINLLIKDASIPGNNTQKKYSLAFLILINRSIQHIESVRVLTERGLYGDSFVLMRSIMSDLAMMQYLHFHPELLDLFLNEKQEDYQANKDFKKSFNETVIENDLSTRGLPSFSNGFQILSKASHASSFGSQLYGSKGKVKGQYHMNYGPKFQAEKALLLMDFIISGPYDLLNNIFWHRFQSQTDIDLSEWKKVEHDLEKLSFDVNIFSEATKEVVKTLFSEKL